MALAALSTVSVRAVRAREGVREDRSGRNGGNMVGITLNSLGVHHYGYTMESTVMCAGHASGFAKALRTKARGR